MALTAVASTLSKSPNSVELYKGQSKDLEVTIVQVGVDPDTGNEGDVAVDLTGATIYFTVKWAAGDPGCLISKKSTVSTEISINTPETDGIATIHLLTQDTYKLEAATYVFDVWVVLSSGKAYPVIEVSEFIVKEPVTVVSG